MLKTDISDSSPSSEWLTPTNGLQSDTPGFKILFHYGVKFNYL